MLILFVKLSLIYSNPVLECTFQKTFSPVFQDPTVRFLLFIYLKLISLAIFAGHNKQAFAVDTTISIYLF